MLTILAMAIAGTLNGPASQAAEPHGYNVQMPSSISESAPWLTGAPPASTTAMVNPDPAASEDPVGATFDSAGSGIVSFASGADENAEYWRLDEGPGD